MVLGHFEQFSLKLWMRPRFLLSSSKDHAIITIARLLYNVGLKVL
jgi:hypothetical protein